MLEELEINSFDDLKTALGEALHNGAASPEAADYLMERFEVLCMDIDNVFLAISANDIKEYYPNLSLDEAREVRDNANENLWNSGGYDDINDVAWGQIKAEVKCVRDARHDSRCEETSLDDLAEAYGDEGACQESCGSRDTEGIPR